MLLRGLCDMSLNVLHLPCPPSVILAERLVAAGAVNLAEPGLRQQKQCTVTSLRQLEFDERGRLLRVIHFRIDGVRMPGEGEELFGLHFLHVGFPDDVLVPRMCNVATRDLPCHEWAIQFHSKPLAKLTIIRQRAPDPRNRRLECNALLNTIIHIEQPPGCILTWS